MALKVKEAEVSQLRDELTGHEQTLTQLSSELDVSVEKYSDLYDEHQLIKRHLEQQVETLGQQLRDVTQRLSPAYSQGTQLAAFLSFFG